MPSLIKELPVLATGFWFDGTKPVKLVQQSEDPDYAPGFVLKNAEKYKKMLVMEET